MKRSLLLIALIVNTSACAFAQPTAPVITSWILNTTGATGYAGIPSNVQLIRYSDANVYISCTCIPGYDIGPWGGNPNIPANQNFVFRITRTPTKNNGTPTATPLGHIGVWSNGVSMFNAKDARTYNNAGVWNQNAIVVEGPGFDACLGHPQQNGEYHHHLNPRCLYDVTNTTKHSPIIGYAFDGYPIYGAHGFANADGSGGITTILSSYRKRAITNRHQLPDGTVLQPTQYGPDVNGQYPLGYYIEDYEFIPTLGHLDEHNGRFCVTPEYPEGIYAYFTTVDSTLTATYPYTLGPTYYGNVTAGNTGPGSGHVVPTESVITYSPPSGVDVDPNAQRLTAYPTPASTTVNVQMPLDGGTSRVSIVDQMGRAVRPAFTVPQGETITIPVADLTSAVYMIRIENSTGVVSTKMVVQR